VPDLCALLLAATTALARRPAFAARPVPTYLDVRDWLDLAAAVAVQQPRMWQALPPGVAAAAACLAVITLQVKNDHWAPDRLLSTPVSRL